MTDETRCTNPVCRSAEKRRDVAAKGLCQNCYTRFWRSQRRDQAKQAQTAIEATHAALRGYAQRVRPTTRLRAIRRLLDQGKLQEEVIVAFEERAHLFHLVAGLKNPVKELKRDLASIIA